MKTTKPDQFSQFLDGFLRDLDRKVGENARATLPYALARICRLLYSGQKKDSLQARAAQRMFEDFWAAHNKACEYRKEVEQPNRIIQKGDLIVPPKHPILTLK